MNKKTIGIIIAVVAAAVLGAALYPGRGEAPAQGKGRRGPGGPQQPTVVNVVKPARQDVPVVQQSNGTVTPVSMVDLRPQTTSTVRKVHIREGQSVRAGQLMFSLDDREDAAGAERAEAQVARDRAALADLERQYRRSQELFEQKYIAQSQVDSLKSQVDAARALAAANAAAARASRVAAGYNAIRAPMSGRVGAIDVYAGSLVQPATSLTTITQLDPINVAFTLPEAALPDLLAAQRAGTVAVEASPPSGTTARGKLSFIDNTVDPVAGTIKVKALFANPGSALWPGQFVSTKVAVRTLRGATVIPQDAIINSATGTFVYVVAADGTAQQVPVQRLHAFGTMAAVSGLSGSEQVITDGKQNLRPGAKVRIAGQQGGAAGKGSKGTP